jgi:peptide/nickel transport system substrate-binding protein
VARALAAFLLIALLAGAASAAAPKRGGTLVIARPPVTCLNPFAQGCNVRHDEPVLTQVLEGAFEVGPDLVFRPNLVSRVEPARNPFRLTYHIRPQARWSDGVPVTSADFHFTYRTFLTRGVAAIPELRDQYAKIRRFRTLGPKSFRIELREPFADWRFLFDVVLPRHVLAGEDITAVWRDRIDDPRTGRPIGNGPFLVERLRPGQQLTLVRNPRYWRRHAYLDRLVWALPRYDPSDELGALRRNEVHMSGVVPGLPAALSADQARAIARLPGWRVAAWPTLGKELLSFRVGPGGHPALRNRLVRQAIAFGVDRVELARRVNSELGRRARPLDSAVFFPEEPGFRPNWRGYRHDPGRARQLLERAGCRRGGDGVYVCAGQRLRLRLVTTAGRADRALIVELLRSQLQAIGVDVQPTFAPLNALTGSILPGGNFHVALYGWVMRPGGGVSPDERCGHEDSATGYCNRLTERDVQQVDRIVDPRQRARVLNAADAKLARDVATLPLFQGLMRMALRTSVRGFVPGGTLYHFNQTSEDWWLAP